MRRPSFLFVYNLPTKYHDSPFCIAILPLCKKTLCYSYKNLWLLGLLNHHIACYFTSLHQLRL